LGAVFKGVAGKKLKNASSLFQRNMSFVSCPQKNRNKRLDQDYSNRFIAPLLASALEKGQTVNFLTLPAQEWAHERSIVERFPEI
jgi:hypothetical protein